MSKKLTLHHLELIWTKVKSIIPDVSEFITGSEVDAKILPVTNRISVIEGKESGWDAKAELTDITTAIATEVANRNSAIAEAISGITQFDLQICPDGLPEVGKKGTIYLVPKSGSSEDNYIEYIWVTNRFEPIGTVSIDLTNYYTKTEINDLLVDKQDIINDLATIRSGAALGTTALQSSDIVDDLESTASNKPISARAVNVDIVNYIDDSITSTMNYIDQQDNSEHAGRVAGDNILSGRLDVIEAKEADWDAKYSKPSTGIPKTDLASAVQTSLGKADSAIQNVKTINGQSIVGTGNIDIQSGTDLPLSVINGMLCITYNN